MIAALGGIALMESEGTVEGKKSKRTRRYVTAFVMGIGSVSFLQKVTGGS